MAAPCARLQLVREPVRRGGVVRPLNSGVRRLPDTFVKYIVAIAATTALGALAQVNGQVPDYRRAPAATRLLVERAVSIKTGESKSMVLDRLGIPDRDQVLTRKERPDIVGRAMTYDIVKWKRGAVNALHDEYVSVWLNPKDMVESVTIRADLGK